MEVKEAEVQKVVEKQPSITWNDIVRVNKELRTTKIKGKEYVEVNQRVKAFRMIEPNGSIQTEVISVNNGVVLMKASVYDSKGRLLSTGHAYEKESSSFINKTSYIENCETSAIGRALGFVGLGIDTSIASYEEVGNAIKQQETMELEKALSNCKRGQSKLDQIGVDFRDKKNNEKICAIAKVETQDIGKLNDTKSLNRLANTYAKIVTGEFKL